MLIGAEFDAQPSYSRQSSFAALRSYSYKITQLLPFLRDLRILRTWAGICDISADFRPIMGVTGVDGFLVTTGWGTWGFKAIPAGGEGMAELIATGQPPALIAPFALDRFRTRPRPGRPGLDGDPLMLWLDCPRCGRRPLDEFAFGGERRPVPDRHRPIRTSGTSTRSGSSTTPTASRPSAGSTRLAAGAGSPCGATRAWTRVVDVAP